MNRLHYSFIDFMEFQIPYIFLLRDSNSLFEDEIEILDALLALSED